MKIFCLNATAPLGERIAALLGARLGEHEEREFDDTEFKVRALDSVEGEQVFVCQSSFADDAASASDKLFRLLVFIGALRDDGAAEVVAVVPYLAYARKDRRTKSGDPITTRYVAAFFEAVGTDAIVTADVHNHAAFENAFRCRKVHVEAAPLFVGHFSQRLAKSERVVVLSPDAGGAKRARAFADAFASETGRQVELAIMEKQRREGRVAGEAFAGAVHDAVVIVVDDMISGGTTMLRAAQAARARGARAVHAAATHAVFAAGADEALANPELDSIVVTDTAGDPRARCPTLGAKLEVLDSAPLFAAAIQRLTRRRL